MFSKVLLVCLLVGASTASEIFSSGIEKMLLNADRSTNTWTAQAVNATGQGNVNCCNLWLKIMIKL